MAYGIIYLWRCTKTNMCYVGQTIDTLSGRWKGHVRSAFNPKSRTGHWKFPQAIREHGVSAFVGEVLCECSSPEELSVMESHWIHELNTLWPHGYNMRDGSNFVSDSTRKLIAEKTAIAMANPETKSLMSKRAKERDERTVQLHVEAMAKANRGKQRPVEVRAKLSAAAKKREAKKRLERNEHGECSGS